MGGDALLMMRVIFLIGVCVSMGIAFPVMECAHESHASGGDKPQEVRNLKKEFRLKFSMAIERFYRKSLTIDQTGRCELRIESNIEQPANPEIGRYVTQIGAQEAEKLRDRVVDLAETPVPKEEKPLPPGIPLYEVVLEENGNRQSRSFDPYIVPKRYQVIGREIAQIEKDARGKMEMGLRVDFAMENKQLDRGKIILLAVRLAGAGAETIRFNNPLQPPPNGFGRITLSGVRSDVKAEEMKFFHRQAHHFSKSELRDMPPGSPDKTRLQLKPGEALSLSFGAVLDWPPGKYNVKIIFETTGTNEDDRNFIVGRVTTPPQPLGVTGEAKPGDEGQTEYTPPKL